MVNENPYASPEDDVEVSVPTELAGRGARLGGSIVDGLLTMTVATPALFATGYLEVARSGALTVMGTLAFGLLGFMTFLVLNGYLLATHGQTVGKWVYKTRIVATLDDKILPLWRVCAYRYVPLLIAFQLPVFGPIIGLADPLFIFRKDRRCVHDLIAGTRVIVAVDP